MLDTPETRDQKIEDMAAEYGIDSEKITSVVGSNGYLYAVDDTPYVYIIGDSDIESLWYELETDAVFLRGGPCDTLPLDAIDRCASRTYWSSAIRNFYLDRALSLAKTSFGSYPNELAHECVEKGVIDDEDMDRYFCSDGEWLDENARKDLVHAYSNAMARDNENHPCRWYMDTICQGNREALGSFLRMHQDSVEREKVVEEVAHMKFDSGYEHFDMLKAIAEKLATFDHEVHPVGEFHGLFVKDPEQLRDESY